MQFSYFSVRATFYEAKKSFMRLYILLLVVLIAACSKTERKYEIIISSEDQSPPDSRIEKFHDYLSRNRCNELYPANDKKPDNPEEKPIIIDICEFTSSKLGPVIATKEIGTKTKISREGTLHTLRYETSFRSGKGMESFTFQKKDNQEELVEYHLESKELNISYSSSYVNTKKSDS